MSLMENPFENYQAPSGASILDEEFRHEFLSNRVIEFMADVIEKMDDADNFDRFLNGAVLDVEYDCTSLNVLLEFDEDGEQCDFIH